MPEFLFIRIVCFCEVQLLTLVVGVHNVVPGGFGLGLDVEPTLQLVVPDEVALLLLIPINPGVVLQEGGAATPQPM